MLEQFSNKRSKYELIFSFQIYKLIPKIMDLIVLNLVSDIDSDTFLKACTPKTFAQFSIKWA